MTTEEVILKHLLSVHPRLSPERLLVTWVNPDLLTPLSRGEMKLKLEEMEGKGWVTFVTDAIERDEHGPVRKWIITDAGRAMLASR